MEDIAAGFVAVLCTLIGLLCLQVVADPHERHLLTRLFLVAFVLRVLFTTAIYSLNLVSVLGGADDTGWFLSWARSRQWAATGPDSLWSMYGHDLRLNSGFQYFSSWFYYALNAPSQIALAFVNCFFNSLTVILIYKTAREFFGERASSFAAWMTVFAPSFLIWSALTIKETWLIFFEIAICYIVLLIYRRNGFIQFVILTTTAAVCLAVTMSLRFYVIWFLIGGVCISLSSYYARRPVRAAVMSTAGVVVLFIMLNQLNIVKFDLITITQEQIAELTRYRDNLADPRFGGASSVRLPFDTTTPSGVFLMLLVGSAYMLLSPFPWQIISGKQIFALPDVLLWWYLVFLFIIPGIRFAWNRHPALLMSLLSFTIPLLLFYSMMFGNVGLAYRQRAQLMPFFLVLAAAGYESRHRQREQVKKNKRALLVNLLQLKLQQSSSAPTVSAQKRHQI